MPLPKETFYSSEDYWNLPKGERAELIEGQLYYMAPPSRIHQKLIGELYHTIKKHIESQNGLCEIYFAPFAVNLDANDQNWVEPDISVICDPDKLTDRGCTGAPDFIIEIVSSGSCKMDYIIKSRLYFESGVREYWIVDPKKEQTTIYQYENDVAPIIFPFHQTIQAGIYQHLHINIGELLQ